MEKYRQRKVAAICYDAVMVKYHMYCLFRPSKKFAAFYGSRKGSFTYTGMPGDEEEDFAEAGSRQFVINDNEVSEGGGPRERVYQVNFT